MALYSTQQIRAIESIMIKKYGVTEYQLMQDAASAAFSELKEFWPAVKNIIVFCGKGKNAGDGYVLAKLAHLQNYSVKVYRLTPTENLPDAARLAAEDAKIAGVCIVDYTPSLPIQTDLIVDALLGTGLQGEVREPFSSVIQAINAASCPKLAIDVPSGIDADRGEIMGHAIRANITVTFIGLKQGLFTNKAPAYCGAVICNKIGVPKLVFEQIQPSTKLMDWEHIKPLLPKRLRYANKGDYGHVLVIGGDYGMGGAVRLAAEAAMRVGAGLVSVATRPEHVPVVCASRPELMCHQVEEPQDLDPLLARATVLVIGPGLGKTDWARALFEKLLRHPLPKIIDADALNLLSEKMIHRQDWILTPHPGEAGRLLDCTTQMIQQDRFLSIAKLQERYGGVIVLKGVGTLIKDDKDCPSLCPAGNPGMATGGMGDILSGIIGGLVAQRLSLKAAADAGVFIHAFAADKAAAQGGERGLLATDLLPHLRSLVNPE